MKLKVLSSPRRAKCLNTDSKQDANEVRRRRQIFERTWTLLPDWFLSSQVLPH